MDEFVFPSLIIIMTKFKKCSRQKTVASIGWLDELEKQYDDPIAYFYKNVWRSSMKKNRKSRLQSTLLFTIQIDFVSVITCEKTLAILHCVKSIMSLASIHF
mgnify:CR=1 FL=1